jgi:surface polysaccharide O-acyltransferase-like enzyme
MTSIRHEDYVATSPRAGDAVIPRDLTIDSIRGIAILMVIGIHSLHQPLDAVWEKALDAALRPAVPLFLFVSGYLTAHSRRVPVLKRFRQTLIPYTIAFVAAYAYMALHNPAMNHKPWVTLARYMFGYVFVYYYVPIYLGCTLLLWLIFRQAARHSEDTGRLVLSLALAILVGLIAGSYLDPLLAQLGTPESLIEEVRLRDIPFWFAFMALGTMVGLLRAEGDLRKTSTMLLAATVFAYGIYAAVRIFEVGDAAAYDSVAFFAYAALICLAGLAMTTARPALGFIGSGSYFIYLWHIFVVMMMRDHGPFRQSGAAIESVITYAVTAAVSLTALVAIRSIFPARLARWLGA